MELKYKSALFISKMSQFRIVHSKNVNIFEEYLAIIWTIECSKNMKKRTFTSARVTDKLSKADDANRLISVERYASAGPADHAVTSNYTYDDDGRLIELSHFQQPGSPLAFYTWTFDAANRLIQHASVDGTIDYTYDARGVMLTPGLIVDGELKLQGRVPSLDQLEKMLL